MNTPEQIAEKWAKSLATGRLDNFGAIKSAIEEATQPLHQRLIAAEVQVGKMRSLLEYACIGACNCLTKTPESKYHTETCLYRQYREAIDGPPSPRTHEAFTAMVMALEPIRLDHENEARHNEGQRGMPQGPCQCAICSAIQLAKEVAG